MRSFLAVADALSFVRASHVLHLSQPALTTQIQQLEEELGVTLFFRNKRRVDLTDAGRLFVGEATEALDRTAKAIERVRRASRGEIGLLRIGFVSSAALGIIPNLVSTFRRKYPNVQLELLNLRTTTQLEQLAARTLDIGFVRLPAQQRGLAFTPIHSEPFVAVMSKQHRLASQKTFSLKELAGEKFVLYGRRWAPGFFDQVTRMCADAGFTPDLVQETGEMYTALALVAAGDDVSILPRSVVLSQARGVVAKPLPKTLGLSEIALVTREEKLSPTIDNFVAIAKRLHY
jgi:DNA-binding transcriptional LysR family regulator